MNDKKAEFSFANYRVESTFAAVCIVLGATALSVSFAVEVWANASPNPAAFRQLIAITQTLGVVGVLGFMISGFAIIQFARRDASASADRPDVKSTPNTLLRLGGLLFVLTILWHYYLVFSGSPVANVESGNTYVNNSHGMITYVTWWESWLLDGLFIGTLVCAIAWVVLNLIKSRKVDEP